MSQQPSTNPSAGVVATPTLAPGARKRKKSPKPKEKRAPGDAAPKRTKVALRKEQEAAEAAAVAAGSSLSGSQGQQHTHPQSHSTAGDDEEIDPPRSPNRRRRVINTESPETPSLAPQGLRVGSRPDAIATSSANVPADPHSHPIHLGTVPPAQGLSTLNSDLRRLIENQNALMRETGLLMRELLKHKLGHPAVLPPTPMLDSVSCEAHPPGKSSHTGIGTAGSVENGSTNGGLGILNNGNENGLHTVSDRGLLGIGQPPQRAHQAIEPQGFANGVAFNIGSISQPVTVAPLQPDNKPGVTESSPPVPGLSHLVEPQEHHQQHHYGGPSSGDLPPPTTAGTPMFRDTSQPSHMADAPRNASYSMPSQHPPAQSPHLSPNQQDEHEMAPVPAPVPGPAGPVPASTYVFPAQYTNFHQLGYVRPPGITAQQQQAILHQQAQQQQQILAQIQRQQMSRQAMSYYAQQQQMPGGMHPPGGRIASATATAGRPRPFYTFNTVANMPTAEDDPASSDPLTHSQPQMSPNAAQLARMQRAQSMGMYMRQVSGQPSTSPVNATFPGQHFNGVTTPSLGQNPFLGAAALSIPAPASGAAPSNSGFGGGGGGGGLPAGGIPSGGSMTPSMYVYGEPSPFSATFPTVPGGEVPSPFSFAPPEMDTGGVGRARWGEEDADEESLREVTPGRRFEDR